MYRDHVLPRIVHATCGAKYLHPLRERVCSGLAGQHDHSRATQLPRSHGVRE